MAMPISKSIKFPIFQSFFDGVIKTATVKIINAIPKAIAMLQGFSPFSKKELDFQFLECYTYSADYCKKNIQ